MQIKGKIFILIDTTMVLFYTVILFIISELFKNCLYKNLYMSPKTIPSIVSYGPTVTLITIFVIIFLYIMQIIFEAYRTYLKTLSLQITVLYFIYFVMCVLLIIEPIISYL